MEEEKNLLNELMKRYIELKMSVERMEAEQKHSPGCIVKKGAFSVPEARRMMELYSLI